MIDQITGNIGEYLALYIVLACTFALGWILGALVTRSKLEDSFGRLLADICEEDMAEQQTLSGPVFNEATYPKDAVDRVWQELMRGRMS